MNRLELDPFQAIVDMIREDIRADIHGDLYGVERVAESVADYIDGLKARIKKLEGQLADASWREDYRRGMNF